MSMDLECIYCNTKFSVKIHANFSVICPCCKRGIYRECEYGFGPVTPCQIYLGEKVVGVVESDNTNYYLRMYGNKVPLNNTYLDAILESETIVCRQLNILRHHDHKDIQILTKKGSLCFYGDWPGRPYDNYHKIIHASFDGEILEIFFKRGERLLVYNPENITSTEQELKIEKSQKLKWIYDSYIITTYTAECETLFKETKYGIEHLTIKEPFLAVYMG
ncbi:MAG: hypothetical protein HDR20_12060 [Lachnospiraceae bacterium]|nr:hypothetical protein [Lachnospiraceae bacterium]